MPSGKKSKQLRRAARPRRRPSGRRAAGAARQASPRVLAIGGGVVARRRDRRSCSPSSSAAAARAAAADDLPAVGTRRERAARRGRRRRDVQGHPADTADARLADRAGDDGRVHRPPVPVLPAVRDPGVARRSSSSYIRTGKVKVEMRAVGVHRPRLDPRPEARCSRPRSRTRRSTSPQLLYDNQGTENTGWLNDDMVGHGGGERPGPERADSSRPTATSAAVKAAGQGRRRARPQATRSPARRRSSSARAATKRQRQVPAPCPISHQTRGGARRRPRRLTPDRRKLRLFRA